MASEGGPSRICRYVLLAFLFLYLAALALLAIGTFGLFGNEQDPLAGLFLIPLGIPWVYVLDFAWLNDNGRLLLGLVSPVLNLVLIRAICRALHG